MPENDKFFSVNIREFLIGISNGLPEHDDKYELHRLLSTLLSMELSANEKLKKELNLLLICMKKVIH